MKFWLPLIAYEAVWLISVTGAGRGAWWPGTVAAGVFALWRLSVSRQRSIEVRLAVVALLLGAVLETLWVRLGLLQYAAAWPVPELPAWLMGLWLAFALTIVPLFGFLHDRPLLAAAVGTVGGPLAYWGAARGWHAVRFATPPWHGLLALALGWAVALPLLCVLVRPRIVTTHRIRKEDAR
jgi:hypothetical protein